MKTRSPFLTLLLIFILGCSDRLAAQSYGLGFNSHEVVQDQRTGLDLSPGEMLCFDHSFELYFDLTLFPSRKDYFGYVVRLVADSSRNIDLIYDKNAKENSRFKIVIGEAFSRIAFDIPQDSVFSQWNTLRLRFDYSKQQLTLRTGGRIYTTPLQLAGGTCFKIIFGANGYLDYKTTDVPPMKIRNIGIKEEGKPRFFWPLNQYEGNKVTETLTGRDALATEPLWIRKLHYQWQPVKSTSVSGPASVAFDTEKECLYIVGNDSLYTYSVPQATFSSMAYLSGPLHLLRGNQSLVDASGQLITVYIDRKTLSRFDPETRSWTENFNPNTNITDFWLYNKFYSETDSSLYFLGGYGHFVYKNLIQRYHFPSGSWTNINTSTDAFTPRYLAALGAAEKGAYLLGGYGSSSGQQLLNPRNLYDLLYFDPERRTIRKIYDLRVKGEDFAFANSLIVNERDSSFYALQFPKNKFKTSLQLMEGSLSRPEFKLRGSPIPYQFSDVRSFADLFYSPKARRFIAVTLYWTEDNRTKVEVYSLYAPPLGKKEDEAQRGTGKLWYLLGGIFLLAFVGTLAFRRFRKKKSAAVVPVPSEQTDLPALVAQTQPGIQHSSIFLFGDMQVFDRDGNEITRLFTPLIKELFLAILIYTIRLERGISSEKLKDLLWFDKSEESARNNRSVSIVKLKNIIEKLGECSVSKETGYWKLSFDPEQIFIDFQVYAALLRKRKGADREDILKLSQVIKRGPFLPNVSYEWMDSFKAEVSNEIIDTYLNFAARANIAEDAELLIELAGYIFYFDPVNEEAMTLKCKALAFLGKHTLAKNAYENFCKEYKSLYNDEFDKGFQQVLSAP